MNRQDRRRLRKGKVAFNRDETFLAMHAPRRFQDIVSKPRWLNEDGQGHGGNGERGGKSHEDM